MPTRALPERLASVATALAVLLMGGLAVLHLRMVVSPAPQEMREGATVWLTGLLLEGRNLYDLRELPASTNVYGIFYHLVVWPFARIFGNSFQVHRAVSAMAIVLASALMYHLLRRRGTDGVLALVGTMLFYVSSLYFVAPLARPDSLGVLLCVASLALLYERPLTPPRFAGGLALALLALTTKIPLAFPPFILATYVCLFESRRTGLLLGLTSVAAAAGALVLLVLAFPTYINLSLVTNSNANYDGAGHLAGQTADWLFFSLPLTVALISLVVARARTWRPAVGTWRPASAGRPLAAAGTWRRPSPFVFASAANSIVFLGWLGWHPGAHMTYLFQLVTPVLIPAVFPALRTQPWPRALTCLALPAALLLNAHYFPMDARRFGIAEASFAQLDQAIASHPRVLGSTDVAGLLALSGRQVVDSGQSEYFAYASASRSAPWLVPAERLGARWDAFAGSLAADIETGRYDLIIRNRKWGLIPEDVVRTHYRRTRTIEVDFAWSGQRWPVDLWEPAEQSPLVDK